MTNGRGLRAFGPGLLLAATGVGAGDLATGAFAGAQLGVAVLWAVLVGALLKFVLNEALARLQLATGRSFLESMAEALGRPALAVPGAYFLLWCYFVGAALMSACGAVMHAIAPWQDAVADKRLYGAAHSLVGLVLVWFGGFALFERVMRVCIGLMFVVVVLTAARLLPGTEGLLAGLLMPRIPPVGQDLAWTLALIGGVGGTVTVLCHGYWMRESGCTARSDLPAVRLDLALAYAMTAVFGLAMVVIGAQVPIDGRGAGLIVSLSTALGEQLGPLWRGLFLVGAWGAMFSSLLGVWQAVPYLYADSLRLWRADPGGAELTRTPAYRGALLLLATLPMAGLFVDFRQVQLLYAVAGALFLPALALVLLWLGRREAAMGWPSRLGLLSAVTVFAAIAALS